MRGLWFCAVVSLFTSQPLRVVVNLPAFRVDAYVGDSVVQSSPIAIGMLAIYVSIVLIVAAVRTALSGA